MTPATLDPCCGSRMMWLDRKNPGVIFGDQTRWKEHTNGLTRECLWCGHHVQVKLDWTETVNHTAWVPA